jgi:hypothetical protein
MMPKKQLEGIRAINMAFIAPYRALFNHFEKTLILYENIYPIFMGN